MDIDGLPGQATLEAWWAAIAHHSPGARVERTATAVAAVFPDWLPLNNAIVVDPRADLAEVARELGALFGAAGVAQWAYWLPSDARDFATPARPRPAVPPMPDEMTIVMTASLDRPRREHRAVVPTSIATVARLDDEPLPLADVDTEAVVTDGDGSGLAAWAYVEDGSIVASAYSFVHGDDCGVFAVATVPAFRRRGIASALVDHVLARGQARGATSASLQATEMGLPLYESLGFEAVGRYEEHATR